MVGLLIKKELAERLAMSLGLDYTEVYDLVSDLPIGEDEDYD